MSGLLGSAPLGAVVPGSLCGPAPRKLCVDVDDVATLGWRSEAGRLIVLHATRQTAELRDYKRDGSLVVLATLPGARQIACEDAGARLIFFVDGVCVFEVPKGRERWEIYRSA